jgi:hypothetical protein
MSRRFSGRSFASLPMSPVCSLPPWHDGSGAGSCPRLLTFRDVPRNGPYSAARSFYPLPDAECLSELPALRQHETERCLDPEAHLAMYRQLPLRDGHGVAPSQPLPPRPRQGGSVSRSLRRPAAHRSGYRTDQSTDRDAPHHERTAGRHPGCEPGRRPGGSQ